MQNSRNRMKILSKLLDIKSDLIIDKNNRIIKNIRFESIQMETPLIHKIEFIIIISIRINFD